MLQAYPPRSWAVTHTERIDHALHLKSDQGQMRLQPVSGDIVRISCTTGDLDFTPRPGVLPQPPFADWTHQEDESAVTLCTDALCIRISKESMALEYRKSDGTLLLQEDPDQPRTFEAFDSFILDAGQAMQLDRIQTTDGEKQVVRAASERPEGRYQHIRMHLRFSDGEALYGLGQHEEGLLNLRGSTVYGHQANRKIAIPMLLSSRGYGLLVDTGSPFIFSDTAFDSYFYTEADTMQDFCFILGDHLPGVVKGYRRLTGKAPMLPRWAFGYIQSRERYETADEMLQTADEFRRRGIGLDCLVLDWMSWPDGMWGQKQFDPVRFPDPRALTDALHQSHVHMMMSIWPNADEKSRDYADFRDQGVLLPGTNLVNPLKARGREVYWQQAKSAIYDYGVDAWWCDSSEGFTPEWNHISAPEPADAYREFQQEAARHMPANATNTYGLYHAMGMHEGQRACDPHRRVVNLTRSGSTGQQRFGAILWSGDVSATWQTLRRQIAAGLNLCACGLPYWTTDAGAFFVKRGHAHFWHGDYPDAAADLGYCELYTRWLQWNCLCPVFRSHGTDCCREPWQFEHPANGLFYRAITSTIALRYALLPYIYTQSYRVWRDDESMMSMLAFLFPDDPQAADLRDQYMFGPSLMVCPVLEPMHYGRNSRPLNNPCTRLVYFPAGCAWYDYHTGKRHEGGAFAQVDAPIDYIPLFVREGSILPIAENRTYADEDTPITWRVYGPGPADGALYTDSGNGFAYAHAQSGYTQLHFDGTSLQDDQGKRYPFLHIY